MWIKVNMDKCIKIKKIEVSGRVIFVNKNRRQGESLITRKKNNLL